LQKPGFGLSLYQRQRNR